MDNEKIKLKPCPFCGKNVAEISSAHDMEQCGNFESEKCPCEQYEDVSACGYFTVVCNYQKSGCGAASGWRSTIEEAVKVWNRRAE